MNKLTTIRMVTSRRTQVPAWGVLLVSLTIIGFVLAGQPRTEPRASSSHALRMVTNEGASDALSAHTDQLAVRTVRSLPLPAIGSAASVSGVTIRSIQMTPQSSSTESRSIISSNGTYPQQKQFLKAVLHSSPDITLLSLSAQRADPTSASINFESTFAFVSER